MPSASATARLSAYWIGPLFAVLGVLGFSFKAILVKLAYVAHPVDPVTLLALRMLYSAARSCSRAPRCTRPTSFSRRQ